MNTSTQNHVNALTRAAIIAALYAALTLLLAPMSFGLVQIRVSEAMTLLPILLAEAVPALAVGCLISNVLGGCTILDIVFGTLATLLAAVCTRLLRSKPLPAMPQGMTVTASKHEGGWWAIAYTVPASLLERLYGRSLTGGETMRGNFYKCDESIHPHFGSWSPIDCPKPDFHRPECFGEMKLEAVSKP